MWLSDKDAFDVSSQHKDQISGNASKADHHGTQKLETIHLLFGTLLRRVVLIVCLAGEIDLVYYEWSVYHE